MQDSRCRPTKVTVTPGVSSARRYLTSKLKGAAMPAKQSIPFVAGARYGRLTVLDELYVPSKDGRRRKWRCLCSCGNETLARPTHLIGGRHCSCGCLKNQKIGDRRRIHGLAGSEGYWLWRTMHRRCTNPNATGYKHYGGRGISVCQGWHSCQQFLKDMMETRPSRDYSLDRIDNNQGYFCGHCAECVARGRPANCRWATKSEQARNQRPRKTKDPHTRAPETPSI